MAGNLTLHRSSASVEPGYDHGATAAISPGLDGHETHPS